jgi:hypothetical protein
VTGGRGERGSPSPLPVDLPAAATGGTGEDRYGAAAPATRCLRRCPQPVVFGGAQASRDASHAGGSRSCSSTLPTTTTFFPDSELVQIRDEVWW